MLFSKPPPSPGGLCLPAPWGASCAVLGRVCRGEARKAPALLCTELALQLIAKQEHAQGPCGLARSPCLEDQDYNSGKCSSYAGIPGPCLPALPARPTSLFQVYLCCGADSC